MAPRDKVNAEQKEFLLSYASEYREVQKHGTFTKFWPRVFLGWFSHWPEEENDEIEDAEVRKGAHKADINRQQKYIKCWYRNHALPKARSHALPPEEVVFVQTAKEKTKRCPQLLEHYQNQYYKEKIAPDVSDKLTKDGTDDTLGVVREKTKEAWRLEDVAVKARITEEHAQLRKDFKQAREEKKRLEKEEAKARTEPTPSSYAAGIASIAKKFGAFSADVGPASGWSFVLIAGGPDPSNDGCINTMAYHYGSNVFGLSVTDYDPEFKAKVTPIFNRFLQTCYSPEQCANRALSYSPATTTISPIAVEEVAEEALPPSLSLSTPQETLPTPNPPSLASPNLPSQAPVLPTAIPASPLSLPKVPPGLLPYADTPTLPTSLNAPPGLPSSPDAPSDPVLMEIPPEFEFDWGSFAPYNHYAGMQCTIPPTGGHMSLLDEMVAPLPIDCYSQGVAMPVPSFLHSSSIAQPISQPIIHQSTPIVLQAPPILQPVVHQSAPPTPSGAALPMLQPVVPQAPPMSPPIAQQPAPVVLQAPPILQPVVHQPAPPAPSAMLPGADTPALAPIIPATGVHAPDDINGPGSSALLVDAISTDITSKSTKPPRRKRPRDDGTDPSFIVTTKRARKPQERTEIDTITKPLVKDKENRRSRR